MKQPSIVEFAHYRFVRDRENNVITLPAQGIDERSLLVLDCERWGMARLHIFEDAARREDKLEAFQEEMQRIARMRSDSVVRVTSWGRDENELFYASEMQDGEPLPAYLDRAGGVPFSVAAEWVGQLFSLLESVEVLTASFERFTTLNFQVIIDHFGIVRPVFSEFYGWTRPGAQVREHPLDWYLAQIFCSLVAGVPVRTFHSRSLPRNFDHLDEVVQVALLDSLEEKSSDSYAKLREVLADLSKNAETERFTVPLPRMPVREWYRDDLRNSSESESESDHELSAEPDLSDELYVVPARIRGKSVNIQVLPGKESIPREGWLNQHHDATRRPGRGNINQLQVGYIEDRGSLTLVGEERVDGVDLASLLREIGPRTEGEAVVIARKICGAIDLLEQNVGASSVWWLPPENVFFLTGTRSREASAALVGRKGPDAWESLPIKLRLHQTSSTLKEGVNLPPAVRNLSRVPGRKFRACRRSAILLPLVWQVLVGTRFRWAKPIKNVGNVSPSLIGLMEEFRIRLRDEPESVEVDLLESMGALDADREAGCDKADFSEQHAKGEAALAAAFSKTLFEGALDRSAEPERETEFLAAPEDEKEPPVVLTRAEPPAEGSPSPEPRPDQNGTKGSSPWLWPALAGVIAAAIFGYQASDWSEQQSPYQAEIEIEFPRPEFDPPPPAEKSDVLATLQDFFLTEGGPQNLKLLHLLEVFDFEANRIAVENALRSASKERNPTAALLLGELSRTRGKDPEVYRPLLKEAARMGDGESQFRYASDVLSSETGSDERSEAISMLGLAAAEGHDPARELWAVTVMEEDPAGAFQVIEAAANSGIPSAIFTFGLFQARGIGTEADRSAAVASFKKAAELGEVDAMYWYARCLEAGVGVEPNYTEAQRWMKNAAAQGQGAAARWCREREVAVTAAADSTGSGE